MPLACSAGWSSILTQSILSPVGRVRWLTMPRDGWVLSRKRRIFSRSASLTTREFVLFWFEPLVAVVLPSWASAAGAAVSQNPEIASTAKQATAFVDGPA